MQRRRLGNAFKIESVHAQPTLGEGLVEDSITGQKVARLVSLSYWILPWPAMEIKIARDYPL